MSGRRRSAIVALEMLEFQITDDGGLRITGSERDLRELATWILMASATGSATAAYVSDTALTSIDIAAEEPVR
jgi:hypothetical protein